MPLKIRKRGQVYHYSGTVAGQRLRGSTGTAIKEIAQEIAAAVETKTWKRDLYGPESVLTFADAALMYRAAGKSGTFLEPVEDYFKDTLVRDIKAATIKKMAMELFGHCSNTSRNRLAIIPTQAIINFAADSELCARIHVKRFRPDTKEKTHATLEWVKAFQKEAQDEDPELGAWALFMFLTGARPTEALEADVDLPGCTALLHESKIGHQRRAHLPAMLVAALANLPKFQGHPIFYYSKLRPLRYRWNAIIGRAKIQRLTPHSCRHGFITTLLRRKIDVKTVAWLADMSVQTLVETYAHALKDRTLTDTLTDTDLTQSLFEIEENKRKMGIT